MAPIRILITGGSGFIGSRVARLLANSPAAPALRLLTRSTRPAPCDDDRVQAHQGDLCDPDSLKGICDGIDTVLHLASQVGGSKERCAAVNDTGTAALLAEAARAGVGRVVQLGTTAVYRDGRHFGAVEGSLTVGPVSPTSVTRLGGEERVLAAGGVVLRPHLVYGRGDTWMVPAVADFLRALPYRVDGGRALLSVISADDLARVFAALALHPELPAGRVLHASRPEPVTGHDLMAAICRALQRPLPGDVSLAEAKVLLRTDRDPLLGRRLSLLAVDHWYDSSRLWNLLGTEPARDFAPDFAASASWYRAHLSARYQKAR